MINLINLSRLSYLWGAILYQWASTVFLITVTDQTLYLSAAGYLIGSFLFAMSDVFSLFITTGFDRKVCFSFLAADTILTIGSIFFFPSLEKVRIGNMLFQSGGWFNFINHTIKFIQLYRDPTTTWKIQLLTRISNCSGTILFILGNIFLLYDAKQFFNTGFIAFTIGSVGFSLGGCLAMTIPIKQDKQQKNGQKQITQEVSLQNVNDG